MAINQFPDGGVIDGGLRGLRGLRGQISDISPNLGLPINTQSSAGIVSATYSSSFSVNTDVSATYSSAYTCLLYTSDAADE